MTKQPLFQDKTEKVFLTSSVSVYLLMLLLWALRTEEEGGFAHYIHAYIVPWVALFSTAFTAANIFLWKLLTESILLWRTGLIAESKKKAEKVRLFILLSLKTLLLLLLISFLARAEEPEMVSFLVGFGSSLLLGGALLLILPREELGIGGTQIT